MDGSNKKSFILYTDFKEVLDKLTDEQAGKVMKTLFDWQVNGDVAKHDTLTDLITTPIITQFKRDQDKWEVIRLKRSESGKLGGRPKIHKAKKANALSGKQSKAKKAVNVTVNANVNVTSKSKARPSSVNELIEFCLSIDLPKSDGEWAWDKWNGSGWKNNGRAIACWKSTIRSWKRSGYMASQDQANFKFNGSKAKNDYEEIYKDKNAGYEDSRAIG